ncbi:hypothetical protein HY218_00850, partial [Candidatus Saccharibacteria bacterium]|nr:hypothetical protein [Candidatus Saccharibacteria bacterium]
MIQTALYKPPSDSLAADLLDAKQLASEITRPPSERGLEHAKGILEHFFEYASGGPAFSWRYIDRH